MTTDCQHAAPATTPVSVLFTEFAPAERFPIDVVRRQATEIAEVPLTAQLLNSVLNYVLIVNEHRQIVFASRNFEQLLQGKSLDCVLGERPGEALGCVHSHERVGGCGTTLFCAECGAVGAVLSALGGREDVRECRLMRVVDCKTEALDLLVTATPFVYRNERFGIVSVADISHEKRRHVLERVFFHDIINTAGSLSGLMEMLGSDAPQEIKSDIELARHSFQEMLEQILAQKDLVAAERQELVPTLSRVNTMGVLRGVIELFRRSPLAEGRTLCMDSTTASIELLTDQSLIKRVLGNLVKNALEASKTGETIVAGCRASDDGGCFWVHNPGVIPREIELQLFNRSFSTKGKGCGLGTYSVKLLTERYLGGLVSFSTSPQDGTTFFVSLPASPAQGAKRSPL